MKALLDALDRRGLDRAVLFAATSRSWQSVAGVVSLVCIVRFFTPRLQGFHYAILSLISAQGLFELGLGVAVMSFASHEWSGLSFDADGRLAGDAQQATRLAAIARFAFRWYAWTAGCFLIGGGLVGTYILGHRAGLLQDWLGPWLTAIFSAALGLLLAGLLAVVEGCNQIAAVARIRLLQSVVGNGVFWLCAAGGLGLWSTSCLLMTMLLAGGTLVARRYGRFLWRLLSTKPFVDTSWRSGFFAMQWPLAIQAIVGFFIFSFFVPAVFRVRGAHEAGRLGLSLQVISAILNVTAAIATVRQPRLGVLVARGDTVAMTSDWRRGSIAALSIFLAGSTAVVAATLALSRFYPAAAARMLDASTFLLLGGWGLATLAVQCLATYWRAFRVEALGALSILPGLASGSLIWIGANMDGARGAVTGALVAALLVTLPLGVFGWRRTRRRFGVR